MISTMYETLAPTRQAVTREAIPSPTGPSPASPSRALRPVTLVAADFSAFAIAAVVAFSLTLAVEPGPFLRAYAEITEAGVAWHGWATLLVLACLLAYFGGRGHYTSRIPFWIESRTVLCSTAFAFVADGLTSVALYHAQFGVECMLRWLIFVPAALALRQTVRSLLGMYGFGSLRTLVVGDHELANEVEAALRSEPALGYELIGRLSPGAAPRADDASGWSRLLAARRVQLVVMLLGGAQAREMRAIAATLAQARVPLAVVPAMDGLPVHGFNPYYFISHDVLMLTCSRGIGRPAARLVKLVLDQTGAAILLFLLAPLFLVLASLVRRDGGPAFYRQRRVGAGGQSFGCLKFRTMATDADALLCDLLARDPAAAREWQETQKLHDDPRVTPIGRFLRKTSLDELPQLINVLRGEMSLVGPRPIVEAEIARYGLDIADYYSTKPGITGLWQVSGRSNTAYAQRVRLDRWYARNWTLWHDVAILLKTIPAVLRRDGAV
jgi:Undecaprenyl-phosphate galactose phosphotransferase WbaP